MSVVKSECGSEIKRVKKTKSLGVIIDQGLNWEDQFKAIKAKVRGGLVSLKTAGALFLSVAQK